jgi:hypothetical protein
MTRDVRVLSTAVFSLLVLNSNGLHAQAGARTLTAMMPSNVANRAMQPLIDGPHRGLTLDARPGDGVAWWRDVEFGNGTIELDLRGTDMAQQSFVGVAFHGKDDKTFDAIYFRPFNFRAAAEVARSHAVQYVSHPTYTWDKLRADRPGVYEHAVVPPPDPNGWFHARVVVAFPSVKVFVNDIAASVLEVTQLSDRKTGWVGVWAGNNSDGSFANLTIKP